ncbi:hypothetical protein A2Y85_08560 [candidate division WOR-3 bacterium RBG_13_43_14]|uniref:SHSP domain-containing protein n=1 Tax=candidate division WOR-3 bacterium RBG_13_43_14 TaxID=1802590 RepID=A0A1F4U1J2_UNCW3|nr:MAG: hypothetical protein A2Y85_08560 [candidate division WOR-3 bacterium RBG_13_43_14]
MKKANAEIMSHKIDEITVRIDQEPERSEIVNWQPLYDLYTTADEVNISIELAGVSVHDMNIFLNKNQLQITGMRRPAPPLKPDCCTFHTIEIPYGHFYQKIDFPLPVQTGKYHIHYTNGMLFIRIPVIKERVITIED